jgi:2-dehydro-3-deoxyphosphogluconate aldolase/(4S)-4-hydroxy-2-oxoglutarate aldolase
MPDRARDVERIADTGVVAVVRGAPADEVIEIVDALHAGGIDVVELTADTDGVLDMLREVTASFDREEVLLGAGTVLDAETARSVLLSGAEFVVTPSLNEDVIETCNRYGSPVLPGIMTPSEAVTAYQAGADMCKVFPASSVGPGHISALKGPLGQIPLVPTGGVDANNAGDYIEAGAAAVGAGSALVDPNAVDRGEFGRITDTAERFVDAVESAR